MAGDELLERSWVVELHERAGAGEERIIEGIVAPFGEVATVRDRPGAPAYRETLARSAFDGLDPSSVILDALVGQPPRDWNTHDGAWPVGRGVTAEPTDAGLLMGFRVSRTAAGTDALELARDGILGRMSVVMRPISEVKRADGVVERTQVELRRVALLERGAYQGAQVTAVRAAASEGVMPNAQDPAGEDAGTAPATPAPAPATPAPSSEEHRPNRTRVTVDVERADAERWTLGELMRGAQGRPGLPGAYVTREAPIYGPGSGQSFFRDGFLATRGDAEASQRLERHYRMLEDVDLAIQRAGDVLSSEIPGAYPSEYMPGLIVSRVLKQRPMAGFYRRVPLTDGRPRIFPVVSTSTTVAVQSAEGANPAASDFATTATTVTPLLYGGETSVSRQVLDGADPAIDSMLSEDLTEAYMQKSEDVVRTAVEAGATASGVTLTAATPNIGLIGLVLNHFQNVFLPAEGLFLPTTLYQSWLTQLDSTNRPLTPFYGPMNADSQVTDGGFAGAVVAGVKARQSWASTAGTGAGVNGIAVVGRQTDYAVFESNIVRFQYTEGAGAPAAIRVGLWAYLVVGTRRGSRKATGA